MIGTANVESVGTNVPTYINSLDAWKALFLIP